MITFDSNILVYANDERFPGKQVAAQQAVRDVSLAGSPIAVQVVGETQHVLRRKFKRPTSDIVEAARNIIKAFTLISSTRADVETALTEMEAGRLGYWDALLLSTVARAGCTAILTEDMQDGATILGVEIVNPFGPNGLSSRAAELLAA